MQRAGLPLLTGALLGLFMGLLETRRHAYVVPYDIMGVLFFAGVAALIALVLLVFQRSHSVGRLGLLLIAALATSFYATIVVANRLGAWDEKMVSAGQDVRADLVILLREDATVEDSSEFHRIALSIPDPRGGYHLRPGVQSVLGVTVGGHRGYAVQFHAGLTAQLEDLKDLASRSPLVWRVYENAVPDQIEIGRP